MILKPVLQAFGFDDYKTIDAVTTGIINNTFIVSLPDGKQFILQKINTNVFKDPLAMQENFKKIREHLLKKDIFKLPEIIPTREGLSLFEFDGETWRCFEYIKNAYAQLTADTPENAYLVANCFGKFTAGLHDLDPSGIKVILPKFHDLSYRFHQFEDALKHAAKERKHRAESLIKIVDEKLYLLNWYRSVANNVQSFPLHIMHHDCKISNILFEKGTNNIFCPIDLDTTQPGLFFSDIGDMIRSMVPNLHEEATNIDELEVRPLFYKAIESGYLDAMSLYLSKEETKDLRLSGPVLVFMQALRFLIDYLNNDVYYNVKYHEQNKDRAANQFRLLQLLES